MERHYESTVKGEGTSYSAPSVEILSIIAKFICTDCKIQMCIFS